MHLQQLKEKQRSKLVCEKGARFTKGELLYCQNGIIKQ